MMPRLAAGLLLCACLLVVVTEPGTAQEKNSPFAGEYSGPFTTKVTRKGSKEDKGTYTVTIAASGKVTGFTKSTLSGARTEVSGTIENDGKAIWNIKVGSTTTMMKGTLTKTTTGNLKGTLLQYFGREVIAEDEIDLRPKK